MAADTVTRTRKTLLGSEPILLGAVALAALYFGRDIFIPLAMSITLSFLLTPLVMRLERLHLRRGLSVALVVAASFLVLTIVGWVVATQVIGVVNDLPNYRDNIQDKIESIHSPSGGPLAQAIASIKEISGSLSVQSMGPAPTTEVQQQTPLRRMSRRELEREVTRLETQNKANPTPVVVMARPLSESTYVRSLLMPVVKPLGTLAIVVVFTIYMLLKREDLRNRTLLLAGVSRLSVMTQALNDAAQRISSFLLMNVLVNASYGVVFGVGLYLLHVPNATLWGVLIGILRMVPYFGMMTAGSATILFTLAVFPGWWHPLFVVLLFVGLEILVSNAIEPWLYGTHTGVSSLALLATALVWTLLWGWAGLVLSTPLTVCLIVMGRHVPQFRFLHILLGDEAELAPEAAFYERLLAMDQTEAHAIADRFLEGRNVLELYDGVLLPALVLAEQDRHKGDLDEARSSYLFQCATELIAELTDYQNAWPEALVPGVKKSASGCPVVCISASDQADELASMMLAQLVERAGRKTLLLPCSALNDQVLGEIAKEPDTLICISALPPFAFAHARGICQQVRKQLPMHRIIVGMWGERGETDAMRGRFGNSRPNLVTTTLQQVLAQLLGCAPAQPEKMTAAETAAV